MLEFVRLITSAVAITLVGVHLAFVASTIHVKFVNWFRAKLAAVIGMLTYIAGGLYLYNPGWGRTSLAVVAIGCDCLAVLLMWYQVNNGLRNNVMGLVPIVVRNGKPYESN